MCSIYDLCVVYGVCECVCYGCVHGIVCGIYSVYMVCILYVCNVVFRV